MAYVNVLEWKAENVADWLQGLDDAILPYVHFFINNNVTGKGLLNLTVDDLCKLHVERIGHQEIILEGLDLLKNLHNLDNENLQYVCLRLSCKGRSLCNELRMYGPPPDVERQVISTSTMMSVGDVLDSLWNLLYWLNHPPFSSESTYTEFKSHLHRIGMELATNTQRDTFSEKPIDVIKNCCERLSNLSDTLIQECNDPFILQPASLDVCTIQRLANASADDFGITLDSNYGNYHVISEIRHSSSPSIKVEIGDEIIQVNYQTVVGWNRKKVLRLLNENPSELILTLKKRPTHSSVTGQIYRKPYRVPAREKKNMNNYFNNLPSPRAELLVAPSIDLTIKEISQSRTTSLDDLTDLTDVDSEDDETFLPPPKINSSSLSPTQSIRSVLMRRSRSGLQRRATISGSSSSTYLPYINVNEIWTQKKNDEDEKGPSNSSTLKSNDSGMSSLSADPYHSLHTVDSLNFPTYSNLPTTNTASSKNTLHNHSLDSGLSQFSVNTPRPTPKPRTSSSQQSSSASSSFSSTPNKKKPIPQPRTIKPRLSSDENSRLPIPTSNFKSYSKYLNAPPINSRTQSTPSTTPVTRLGNPSNSPILRRESSGSSSNYPYYMSDVYREHNKVTTHTNTSSQIQKEEMSVPCTFSTFGIRKPSSLAQLPPVFKSSSYSFQSLEDKRRHQNF